MSKYRDNLPQLNGKMFLTDGGMETTLVFHERQDLPCFAAFDLLKDDAGRQILTRYFTPYLDMALRNKVGFVLESATWRASQDWADRLGYSAGELARFNREAIELLDQIRARHEVEDTPMVISACVGPRGDGYRPGSIMSAVQAQAYHDTQIGTFADTAADMVGAITMTNVPEAIGIARAARHHALPVVISFTTETDGRLPTGDTLADAIRAVDEATGAAPAYYMINCAHPTHIAEALESGEDWVLRIRGLLANASRASHAELDEATELDVGDPHELGEQYRELRSVLTELSVLGGCCGTDHTHVQAIAASCYA